MSAPIDNRMLAMHLSPMVSLRRFFGLLVSLLAPVVPAIAALESFSSHRNLSGDVSLAGQRGSEKQNLSTLITVGSASDLIGAIRLLNANPTTNYAITFLGSITLGNTTTLPFINTTATIIIDGSGQTLDGGDVQRGFFIYAGTVTLQNITIQNSLLVAGAAPQAFGFLSRSHLRPS